MHIVFHATNEDAVEDTRRVEMLDGTVRRSPSAFHPPLSRPSHAFGVPRRLGPKTNELRGSGKENVFRISIETLRKCRRVSDVTLEEAMLRARALSELWRCHRPCLHGRMPLSTLPLPLEEPNPGFQQLVVAASGPDGPGIVARMSKRVLDSGGNIELSRMARLAGEFSILMLVTFDVTTARKAEQLRNSLLQIEGLQVNTRWTSEEELKRSRPSQQFRKILLRGVDNPGLVYNLTEYLSSHGINIESLETYNQEATAAGGKLFMMEGVITMPVGLSTAAFIHNLDTLQATLGAEIKISDLPNPVQDKLVTPSFEESR